MEAHRHHHRTRHTHEGAAEEFQLVLGAPLQDGWGQGRGVALAERTPAQAVARVRLGRRRRLPGPERPGLPLLLPARQVGRHGSHRYVCHHAPGEGGGRGRREGEEGRGQTCCLPIAHRLSRCGLGYARLGHDGGLTWKDTAAIEEWILSNVKRFVPDSVKEKWHEWRAAAKGVEKEELGDNHISEDLEKVGWGVEQAQERHKADAST